jgi:hypothetical protein
MNQGLELRMQITTFSACVAGTALALAAPAAAQTQPVSAQLRDGSHDMDFNRGTWHTEITRIPDPFAQPATAVHLSGTVTTKPIWNGKGWLEEIEADGVNGHWEGVNLFFYDPKAHQWVQSFVDSSVGQFEGSPGMGERRGDTIEFYSSYTFKGRSVFDRGVWSDFTPNSHVYTESFSDDGGRTWHPAFIAHVTRAGS